MVISTIGMPPLQTASAAMQASRERTRGHGNDADFFDTTASFLFIHFRFLAYIIQGPPNENPL